MRLKRGVYVLLWPESEEIWDGGIRGLDKCGGEGRE